MCLNKMKVEGGSPTAEQQVLGLNKLKISHKAFCSNTSKNGIIWKISCFFK